MSIILKNILRSNKNPRDLDCILQVPNSEKEEKQITLRFVYKLPEIILDEAQIREIQEVIIQAFGKNWVKQILEELEE